MRRVLGALVPASLMLTVVAAPATADAGRGEDDRPVRLSTAVNEPVGLAVELGSHVRGSVWVEVAVREVGGAIRRDEAAAYLETAPGSSQFDRLGLQERRARGRHGVAELIGQTRLSARSGGEIRLHFWPRVRGDYQVELSVGRGRGGHALDAVTADVHVSSRFDQVGIIDMSTEIVDVTSDGQLLVSTGGELADVSDPAQPVLLPRVTGLPNHSVAITADDRYALFVGLEPERGRAAAVDGPYGAVRCGPPGLRRGEHYSERVRRVRSAAGQHDRGRFSVK